MARILIVDDIQENRYLLEVLLRGYGHEVMSASNGAEALEMGCNSLPDLIIADILMPVMDGYSLCRSWHQDAELRRIPFLFYTATYTEPEDEQFGLSLGAERFIIKPQEPEELERIIRAILERHRDDCSKKMPPDGEGELEYLEGHNRVLIRKLDKKMSDLEQAKQTILQERDERKRVEKTLNCCEERIREILNASPYAVIWMDKEGTVQFTNKSFSTLLGDHALIAPQIQSLFNTVCADPIQRNALFASWTSALREAEEDDFFSEPREIQITDARGESRQVSVSFTSISNIHLAVLVDLTAHKQMESQLLHAQKMEVLGQMTGGIAHDLNNILTAIIGYGHLLLLKLSEEDPSREYVEKILSVTDRASALTSSICAFSRKRRTAFRMVGLNDIAKNAIKMFGRLIPEEIELTTNLSPDEITVYADPGQIEQILMNLMVNARDAISGKGAITISTSLATWHNDVQLPGEERANPACAVLAVEDTGHGLDEATRKRIFEPFFTTKETGRGTGLGLAVVHEIVTLHRGSVDVWSEPDRGARFTIFLPVDSKIRKKTL